MIPALVRHEVNFGLEKAPPPRLGVPLAAPVAGELRGPLGLMVSLEADVFPLITVGATDGVLAAPEVTALVPPTPAAPVSVTRAPSPATSEAACVGSSRVIVTVEPFTDLMVPVMRVPPPNPPNPPAAAAPVVAPAAPAPKPPPANAARSEAKDDAAPVELDFVA